MKIFSYILLLSITFPITAQTHDVDIDYMLRGNKYVKSSVTDTEASGGFGGSDNNPKSAKNLKPGQGFGLKIDTSKKTILGKKYNGYKLYVINQADSIVKLLASDSRINVIAEVYLDKKWQPIEYLPRTTCGNSFHYVTLQQNQYWEFDIPKFTGTIPVKLRYSLRINKRFIYSNEIDAAINPKQLTDKEEYSRQGFMDPYNE